MGARLGPSCPEEALQRQAGEGLGTREQAPDGQGASRSGRLHSGSRGHRVALEKVDGPPANPQTSETLALASRRALAGEAGYKHPQVHLPWRAG